MQASRAQEVELTLCENCFYYHRTERDRCDHEERKVYVTWNEERNRYETTAKFIRPFPESIQEGIRRFAMCDPNKGTCRKTQCTFAHGIPELKAWNSILERRFESLAKSPKQVDMDMPATPPDLSEFEFGQHNTCTPLNYAASEETLEGRLQQDLENQLKEIQVKLCPENYKRKFRHLIAFEEKKHLEILGNRFISEIRNLLPHGNKLSYNYKARCDGKYNFVLFQPGRLPSWIQSSFDYPARYGYLENLSADQIAYATQASEVAFIVPDDESLAKVRLEILREKFHQPETNMYVAVREADLAKIISKPGQLKIYDVSIEFEVRHIYFNSLVKKVNAISSKMIERILPKPQSFLQFNNISDEQVSPYLPITTKIDNTDQWKALRAILSVKRTSPPLLINGSFGTGKTQVLAVATHCLIRHGQKSSGKPVQILICAHHQASADHFIEKHFGPMFENDKDVTIIRVISSSYRADRNSHYLKYYVRIHEMVNYRFEAIPKFLIVVTTFLMAPSLRIRWKANGNEFTHILIDEGSQSREPEAIGPFCLAGPNTKMVIAGDSCQVGPALLVLGDEARENGLKYSLLERLENLYKQCGGLAQQHMVSLNTNYRCHSEVVKIPNDLFYQNRIKTAPLLHQGTSYPLKFICSSITEETNVEHEATLLLEEAKRFITSSRSWKICAATASQTQLGIVRKLSREKFKTLNSVQMLTTYNIQGQEFEALFLSTTEPVDSAGNTTNPTKSPCDPYVFNTVLTRSKSLVVVVGNPIALLRIEDHMVTQYGRKAQCWSSFLNLCLENKSFEIPSAVENNKLVREEFEQRLKRLLDYGVSSHIIATELATVKSTKGDRIEELIQEAEIRAQAAEERAREAERAKVIAETRQQEMEDRLQEAETRRQEAERNCAEQIRQSREQVTQAERLLEECEGSLRRSEEALQQTRNQWVVDHNEIQLTDKEIGRGAWGTVSVALFRGVRVAAKVIHKQIVSRHNQQLVKREMDMAARIRHPNLLQFIGATLEGDMVILTELMPTSLRAELQGDYMSPRQVTSIGLDVARALNYLHLMQPHPFIHRDISSANVLLEPLPKLNHWRAKVSDYGTVNLLQRLDTTCPGNPTYAAPEANDPTRQSPKMDIFSFGALLVEMLTGELPDPYERERLLQVVHHQQLKNLIIRCLKSDAIDRPSATDIISELDS